MQSLHFRSTLALSLSSFAPTDADNYANRRAGPANDMASRRFPASDIDFDSFIDKIINEYQQQSSTAKAEGHNEETM